MAVQMGNGYGSMQGPCALGGINSGKPTQGMHTVPNAKYPLTPAASVRQAVLGQEKAA